MTDIVERLRAHYDICQSDTVLEAADEIEGLRRQLPDEMKDCTILFKECEKGHGRLTATNWIDHGCPHCEIERLRAERKYLGELHRQEWEAQVARAEKTEAEIERLRAEIARQDNHLLIAANIWQDRAEKAEAQIAAKDDLTNL